MTLQKLAIATEGGSQSNTTLHLTIALDAYIFNESPTSGHRTARKQYVAAMHSHSLFH